MKLKHFILLIAAVFMIWSLTVTSFAGTFPDITSRHSWAEEYIENMVQRGLLKGYTDGTFKPDNPISKLEAIILASRILGVTYEENEEFADAALAAFEDDLDKYDIQYKKEAAYLLYRGVLKISELPEYIGDNVKNTAMNRAEVARLLTKVMGGETEALSNPIVVLDYADDKDIPAASKPYVFYISNQGIMKGMEDNKFMPAYNVTRAMMATMMYRVEQAMNITVADVNVTSVNDNIITAVIDGVSSAIELPENVLIRVDGFASPVSGLKSGYSIQIHYKGDEIFFVEALSGRTQIEVAGVIKALSNNKGVLSISVTPSGLESETPEVYTLDENCRIIVDNAETIFSSLKNNYFVKMSVKNGKVVKITAETKEYTSSGTIKMIDASGSSPVIHITIKDGSTQQYNIAADAEIIRNNAPDELRNLAVGDNVTVTVSSGRIKKISATSVNKEIEGTIDKIVISSTAPSITIKTGGISKEYKVAADTSFYVDDKEASIYDMRLGASAKISLKSENIYKITISETVIPSQLIGTVTSVNPVYNVLGIDVVDPSTGKITSQTVVVKPSAKIVDNTSTKITSFKGITAGRSIIAIGSLDNYGTYAVSTIIITQ